MSQKIKEMYESIYGEDYLFIWYNNDHKEMWEILQKEINKKTKS